MPDVIQIQDIQDISIIPWILIVLISFIVISGFTIYRINGIPDWVYCFLSASRKKIASVMQILGTKIDSNLQTFRTRFAYGLNMLGTRINYLLPMIKTKMVHVIPTIKTKTANAASMLKEKATLYKSKVASYKSKIVRYKSRKETNDEESLYKLIDTAGYAYDPYQDLFYSKMDPWQRKRGYCRLYDEAAAPLEMIVDCEPVNFSYDGKRWLIELWKGQYCMSTGAEIGVYNTDEPDLDIMEVFTGPFYNSASNEDRLHMSYSLIKNGEVLFERNELHWWLTGFKLGEFSEPSELTMYINITLKDFIMRDAFVQGLMDIGYADNEIYTNGNTISLIYDKTHTPQPFTRTPETDWLIQRYNEGLCKKYQQITGPYDSFPEKVKAIKEQAPEIYKAIINVGKTRQLFKKYNDIKKYLN